MSSSDISAIGIAIAAIITAIAALRNSSNSKEVVERLKEEVSKLRDKLSEERKAADEEISKLKDHNTFQDEVLLDREKKINALTSEIDALTSENKELREKIGKWHEWGLSIGRLLNETQLSVGYLMSNSKKQTAPLPPLGEIPEQPRVDNEYQ